LRIIEAAPNRGGWNESEEVAVMGTREIAYPVSALTRPAAAPALEVYERAVTQADIWGQVCPTPGGTGFCASTPVGSDLSAQADVQRSSSSIRQSAEIGAFSVMNNASLSKPRFGYRVTSGTG